MMMKMMKMIKKISFTYLCFRFFGRDCAIFNTFLKCKKYRNDCAGLFKFVRI